MRFHSVLVADDHEGIRRSFERLSRPGLPVFVAASSKQALELAAEHQPDLAVIDLYLDDELGLDVLCLLKAKYRKMVCVLLSAYASVDITVQAMLAGAADVIEKPITLGGVLHRLENGPADPERLDLPSLDRMQWEYMRRVVTDCSGNLSLAARKLGIHRSTLRRQLERIAPKAAKSDE
jgi:two-component system, response regulator RegA